MSHLRFAVKPAATDVMLPITILDATSSIGAGVTGLAYDSWGLNTPGGWHKVGDTGIPEAYVVVEGSRGVHTDWGFVEIGNGMYEIQLPDSLFTDPGDQDYNGILMNFDAVGDSEELFIQIDLTASASVQHIAGANVLPLTATQVNTMSILQDIVIYQDAASPVIKWSIVDANGVAVDLTGNTLRFNVSKVKGTTALWTQTGGVGGAKNNEVTVTYTSTNTATTGHFTYYLWNMTTEELLKTGQLDIRTTVKDAAV